MFKNKLAVGILAAFAAITFSVAAQTVEARPVQPASGQVLVPPQVRETAELQKISKRFDIDASVLQTEFDRGWGLKSCDTLLFCHWLPGKISMRSCG